MDPIRNEVCEGGDYLLPWKFASDQKQCRAHVQLEMELMRTDRKHVIARLNKDGGQWLMSVVDPEYGGRLMFTGDDRSALKLNPVLSAHQGTYSLSGNGEINRKVFTFGDPNSLAIVNVTTFANSIGKIRILLIFHESVLQFAI